MLPFKKFKKAFEVTALAVAFAEEGEYETALNYYYDGIEQNNKNYLRKIKQFFDRQQEAITFAEAGETDYAVDILTDEEEVLEKPARLLVVGREGTFSKEIVDYALEMAERMSYNILALNTAPLSCETFKMFSSRSAICEEFKTMSEKGVALFKETAKEKGIEFHHMVMFHKPEEAIEIIAKSDNIAFVVSDFIEDRLENESSKRQENRLFVYSVSA